MTRPKPPRLPELGGMTEAGFNRVVEMIDEYCFTRRHFCTASWTSVKGLRFCAAGCKGCLETTHRYEEWRASLPKTRNKKQRKADAKRAALRSPGEFRAISPINWWQTETALETLQRGAREVEAATTAPLHPRTPLQCFENPVLGVPFELTDEQRVELTRIEQSHREYELRKLKGGG